MEDDTIVQLPRPGASVADDPLLMVLRSGARRMLQQVIEGVRFCDGAPMQAAEDHAAA